MNEEKVKTRGEYNTKKRNISIRTRLSEEEKILFDERVISSNLNQSEFIRQAVLTSKIKSAARKKGVDLTAEGDVLYALSKIGTNLNQIARYYNYGEDRTDYVDFFLRKNLTELTKLQFLIAKKVGEKSGDSET